MSYAQEEINQRWVEVRNIRNNKLIASDELVVKSKELGIPLNPVIATYRQALRDITTQADPFSITWPALDDDVTVEHFAIVSMRQARLALFQQGLLDQVDLAIDGMAEPTRTEVRIEWTYATEVERASPLVASLGAALGLTTQQLDDLFTLAATL